MSPETWELHFDNQISETAYYAAMDWAAAQNLNNSLAEAFARHFMESVSDIPAAFDKWVNGNGSSVICGVCFHVRGNHWVDESHVHGARRPDFIDACPCYGELVLAGLIEPSRWWIPK